MCTIEVVTLFLILISAMTTEKWELLKALIIVLLLGAVCTWRWKSTELAWTCTKCRNSCNKLGDVDLPEQP